MTMTPDDPLGILLDDTEAQLDAAFEALNTGAAIDLSDLPPRIEMICRLSIETVRRDSVGRLQVLVERLDAIELILRAVMTTAQAMAPDTTVERKRAAARYQAVADSISDSPSATGLIP